MTRAEINVLNRTWLRRLVNLESTNERILRTAFRNMALELPLERLEDMPPATLVTLFLDTNKINDAIFRIWLRTAQIQGAEEIREFQSQLDFKNQSEFRRGLVDSIIRNLTRNNGPNIVSMARTFADELVKLMTETMATYNGTNIERLVSDLRKTFRSPMFYRYQIARIARTETTGASNWASLEAGKSLNFQQDKIWYTAGDERVRPNHRELDEVRVEVDGYFESGPVQLLYPGDPNPIPYELGAGEVINCRCRARLVPKLTPDGRVILRDGTAGPRISRRGQGSIQITEGRTQEQPVFVEAKTLKEAKEFLIKNNIANNVSYENISVEYANEVNKALLEIHNGSPINELIIKPSPKSSGVTGLRDYLGRYDSALNNIVIDNKIPFENSTNRRRERLQRKIAEREENFLNLNDFEKEQLENWKKRLLSSYKDQVDDSLRGVTIHEYGHKLDLFGTENDRVRIEKEFNQLFEDNLTDPNQWVKENISEYALTNFDELFAEVYTKKITEGGLPKWLDDYVNKIIEDAN